MHFYWGGSKLYSKWINSLKSVKKEGTWSTLFPKCFSMKIVIYIERCVFFHANMLLTEIHVVIKGNIHISILGPFEAKAI